MTNKSIYTNLLFEYNATNTNSCSIINANAFKSSTVLKKIDMTFATSLKTIDVYAFGSCTNLVTLPIIPQTVTNINSYAFYSLPSLASKISTMNMQLNTLITSLTSYSFSQQSAVLTGNMTSFLPDP